MFTPPPLTSTGVILTQEYYHIVIRHIVLGSVIIVVVCGCVIQCEHDLKIGDLDLDLHGKIGFQTPKIFILTVKH